MNSTYFLRTKEKIALPRGNSSGESEHPFRRESCYEIIVPFSLEFTDDKWVM